jgi:hypothetical protein
VTGIPKLGIKAIRTLFKTFDRTRNNFARIFMTATFGLKNIGVTKKNE